MTIEAAASTIDAMNEALCAPVIKASLEFVTINAARSGLCACRFCAVTSAAWILLCIAASAWAGRAAGHWTWFIWLLYAELSTVPSTATPRAPPIWRVVSFMAEPTPALPCGIEPITELVAGLMVMPMPRATMHMPMTMVR